MANPYLPLLRQLRRTLEPQGKSPQADSELLERWLRQNDEAAFELLLWHHGPLVLGVCRRLLQKSHEVEDAFQATFLILVRKAGSLRKHESLGSWLYKVAYRVACRLRASAARRASREGPAVEFPASGQDDSCWCEVREVLDDEIRRLPERYRSPFILCYLQGKTNPEAAAELGCPVGTILSRLAWARERLRARLGRRGITSVGSVLSMLLANGAEAVSPALIQATDRLATTWGAGVAAAGKPLAASLAEGELMTMATTWLATRMAALFGLGLLGAVVGWSYRTETRGPEDDQAGRPIAQGARAARQVKELVEVPSQRDGVLVLVGSEIAKGEIVPPEQTIETKAAGNPMRYRRLRVGDKVKEGQLLARVNDELAREDVAIAEAKVEAALADRVAAEKSRDAAKKRFDAMTSSRRLIPNAFSEEDYRGSELTWQRFLEEEKAKRAAVDVAKSEVRRSQAVLRMHEIHSPVNGIIRVIYKKRGEAVKNLDPVFQIEIAEEGK